MQRQLYTEYFARSVHLVPEIRSVGLYGDTAQPEKQTLEVFGFALRFDGNSAGMSSRINGKPYTANYPYLILKRPGELHESRGGVYRQSLFFSYPKSMAEKLHEIGFADDFVICELPQKKSLYETFHEIRILTERLDEFGVVDRLDMLCWRLLQECLLVYRQKKNPVSAGSRQVTKIVSWLLLNFRETPNWEKLALQHGLSYRSFLRKWKQTGLPPPNRFLTELRMEEAKRLLTETAMSISDIAGDLQYCDSAWFSVVFRRMTGKTPLRYRRFFQ